MARGLLACALFAVALTSAAAQQALPVFDLALIDRTGAITRIGKLPPGTFAPRLAPDGRQVVFDTADGSLWIASLAELGAPRRFGAGRFPMWSADGQRLLFMSPTGTQLWWQAADGSGAPELIADNARAPEFWSNAAGVVTYITLNGASDYDIWTFSPAGRSSRPLIARATTAEMSSRLSPDGKWLAYQTNESGTFAAYVEPYPPNGSRTRVSSGGERPVWSPDGREIFYDHNNMLYAVPVQTSPAVRVGQPVPLPVKGFVQGTGRRLWDLTPDGKQFLVMLPPQ